MSDAALRYDRAAPGLGEHTEAILSDLGFAADEIDRLAADGVVGVRA
jgi:crotonobetainyl-CoA:carnitine CoA-transferase CaiB-like acyl-CoA transferase